MNCGKTNVRSGGVRLGTILLALCALLLLLFATAVHVDFSGDMEGVYLLRHPVDGSYRLQNDLFLGDEQALLFRLDFEPAYQFFSHSGRRDGKIPSLSYDWSRKNGRGFVMNHLAGGKRLLTCFGRFRDSDGSVPKGLFVGGGLPVSKHENIVVTMNETGMAYYDGKEWKHLWCSVNEAIASSDNPGKVYPPSQWNYLDSSVVERSDARLVLRSRHRLDVDGIPLAITRTALFRAGEKYVVLAVRVKNAGRTPLSYHYVYGDEPWVGEFGTSAGNVGWVKERLYYYEGVVDPRTHDFAGMYDAGNKLIPGAGQTFSGMANFIEWLGNNRPDLVYFSNRIGVFAQERERVPLYSKDNRVIFLQWGPRWLLPGESELYLLAVGMADTEPGNALPSKPAVVFAPEDYRLLAEP